MWAKGAAGSPGWIHTTLLACQSQKMAPLTLGASSVIPTYRPARSTRGWIMVYPVPAKGFSVPVAGSYATPGVVLGTHLQTQEEAFAIWSDPPAIISAHGSHALSANSVILRA